MSVLEVFDDLISKYDFLVNNISVTEEFMRLATTTEEMRIRWRDSVKEVEHLKDELRTTRNLLTDMENRNSFIRHMFDKEKAARVKAENELEQKVNLINNVMETIVKNDNNKISEETKSQLDDIKNSFRCKGRLSFHQDNGDRGRLSIVNEGDTTSSIISDISYSMSEDLSEDNLLDKPRRSVRKSVGQRTSIGRNSEGYTRITRRSDNAFVNKNINLKDGDKVTATSSVTFNKYGVATACTSVDISPPRKRRMSQVIVPPIELITPSAPSNATNSASTSVEDFLSVSHDEMDMEISPKIGLHAVQSIHARSHSTQSHKVIMPTWCVVCNKCMNYGSKTVKCGCCKAILHAACEARLPVPCVPLGTGTPAQNKNQKRPHLNVLASYSPAESPMIPPLIIYCIVEIEKRGFVEEGIYRKSGNADQVKELKKELLSVENKHKIDQLLSSVDIHVVCSTLKDFLRGLDDPLVPNSQWGWFTEATTSGDSDDIKAKLIAVISNLPQPNKETLAYLMLHLQKVLEFPDTKMSIECLSILFGPCIVGFSTKNPAENCAEIDIVNKTVSHLLRLDNYYWNSLIAANMSNIQVTPTSYKSVHHTPSTDSLYRGIRRKMTTPKSTYTERKYMKTPSKFRI